MKYQFLIGKVNNFGKKKRFSRVIFKTKNSCGKAGFSLIHALNKCENLGGGGGVKNFKSCVLVYNRKATIALDIV